MVQADQPRVGINTALGRNREAPEMSSSNMSWDALPYNLLILMTVICRVIPVLSLNTVSSDGGSDGESVVFRGHEDRGHVRFERAHLILEHDFVFGKYKYRSHAKN